MGAISEDSHLQEPLIHGLPSIPPLLLISCHPLPERYGGGQELPAYQVEATHPVSSLEGPQKMNETLITLLCGSLHLLLYRYDAGSHALLGVHSPDILITPVVWIHLVHFLVLGTS